MARSVRSRHHHHLRAGSAVVEYVEVGGEGRGSTGIGELHGICATLVLSQCHRSVQTGALWPGSAVGQHDEVAAPRAGYSWSLAEAQYCSAHVLDGHRQRLASRRHRSKSQWARGHGYLGARSGEGHELRVRGIVVVDD